MLEEQVPQMSSSLTNMTNANMHLFLDIVPTALLVIDYTGSLVMANEQAISLFLYEREELHRQPIEEFFPQRYRALYMLHLKQYFSALHIKPTVSEIPLFGVRKDGSEFPVLVSFKPILLDGTLSAIASVRRTVEMDRAQSAVSELAAILESSNDTILGMTLEGIITSWNKGAERLYGYTANEAVGKHISLIVPQGRNNERSVLANNFNGMHTSFFAPLDRSEEPMKIIGQAGSGGNVERFETVRVKKDGTLVDISLSASAIRDSKGNTVGVLAIAHDISEQKRILLELETKNIELQHQQEQLKASNVELENATLIRNQFIATMSHELRTPLTSIVGFSEMLLEETQDDEHCQGHRVNVERILKNGEHLLSLINDVLDLSTIAAGRMILELSMVNVRELVFTVADGLQALVRSQHLVLCVEVDDSLGVLETHPTKLRQILTNLLANALKFTQVGTVKLSALSVILPENEAQGVAFVVQDTGIGMTPETQAHIFEAFYQADMSYTRRVGGTGLGLNIVKRLTELLGGTIEFSSIFGEGSTFTVTLPLLAVEQKNG